MAAYTTIDNPELYFNTIIYTGDGSTKTISGVGFQPDLVWGKGRNSDSAHLVTDSVRGATKTIYTNTTGAEVTSTTDNLTGFTSDGYTVNSASNYNVNSRTQVNWNWKAGGSASSNSDGDITSSVSANTTSGFSILTYTGNGTNGNTVGTGLNQAAEFVIVKPRDQAENWNVQTQGKRLNLNLTLTSYTSYLMTFNTSTVALTDLTYQNGNNYSMLMYAFHSVQGFSKFGSYTGNGNADGAFVYTGFKPAFIMYKKSSNAGRWSIRDNKRDPFNVATKGLEANGSTAENTGSQYWDLDMLSNGFKLRTTEQETNQSGETFIFYAVAEAPLVNSKGVPCNAR